MQVVELYDGEVIDRKTIRIDQSAAPTVQPVDEARPLAFVYRTKKQLAETGVVYQELSALDQLGGVAIQDAVACVVDKANAGAYAELAINVPTAPKSVQAYIDLVREQSFRARERESTLTLDYKKLLFESGAKFKEWAERKKIDLAKLAKEGDIEQ